jgi:hypothetical protein
MDYNRSAVTILAQTMTGLFCASPFRDPIPIVCSADTRMTNEKE